MSKIRDVFAGGWVCAAPFVLLGAPQRWQVLAVIMGAFIAWAYSRGAVDIAGRRG